MKILSVILENFRIHEHLQIDFDGGINLLIGRNGAGKSSILEAIGFALFNSDLRVKGNKLAVRHGAKTASIEVRFIGNDDNEYRVERKLGAITRWQLFFGDEKSPRYQGRDDLLPRLRELVGVRKNEHRLFSDVVCAIQNRFVDIFAGTPVQRETTFNLLFDTEIYRDLYKHFTGDESIERSYQYQHERLSGELSALDEVRIDIKAVQEEKKVHEKELGRVLEEQRSKSEQLTALKDKMRDLENSQKELSDLELEREFITKELASKQNYLQESEQQVVRAKDAKALITEHEWAFNRYQELAVSRSSLEEQLTEETTVRQVVESKQHRISQIDLELERKEGESRSLIQSEENHQKQHLERSIEQQDLSTEIGNLQRRSEEIVTRGKQAAEPMNLYKVELERCSELEKEKEFLLSNRKQLREQGSALVLLPTEKEQLIKQIRELSVRETELKHHQETKKEREIELRELERAANELADGICPLLKEECNNLNSPHGSTDYFDHRKTDLTVQISELDNLIQPLLQVPEQIKEAARQQAVMEEKLRQLEQLESQLRQIEEKLVHNEQMQSVILEKMALIEPDEPINSILEYEQRFNNLVLLRERIMGEYNPVKEQIGKLQNRFQTSDVELQKIEKELAGFASLKQVISSQKETLSNEKTALAAELTSAKVELARYGTVRTDLEMVQQEQKIHENGYKIYLENREIAASLHTIKQRVVGLKLELESLTERHMRVVEALSRYNKEALTKMQETLLEQEKSVHEILTQITERIVLQKESINQCDRKLEEAKQQGEKITRLLSAQERVLKKLELTALFRGNLKEMGRFVASGIVEDIAANATVHFHKITGRGEWIEWLVNDSEKYTVYLVSGEEGEFRREFSVLSGGEQVAVALSLRAAMAQELASGDFAIFDEPTVNLDSERRIALAESLKSMLGTMEQTIIVTHDDVFREMAQKTIEL